MQVPSGCAAGSVPSSQGDRLDLGSWVCLDFSSCTLPDPCASIFCCAVGAPRLRAALGGREARQALVRLHGSCSA